MATGALASVNEYLSTSYDPDCEYIDGVILETLLAYRWTAEGMHQVPELRTENPTIVVPLAELFEA
jgi:hypothetical protein